MNFHHRYAVTTIRILLGLAFLALGLMGLFAAPPEQALTGTAKIVFDGIVAAKFIFLAQSVFLGIAGALLLINRATPFSLIIAAPFVVGWILYHAFVMAAGWQGGAIAGALMAYLASAWWSAYKPLFSSVSNAQEKRTK